MTKKLTIDQINKGKLVKQIHEKTVTFEQHGEEYSFDIRIQELPFSVTEPLYKRLQLNEDVYAEWIALALVNTQGKPAFTKKQVEENFTQPIVNMVFDAVLGIDTVKKQILEQATQTTKKD